MWWLIGSVVGFFLATALVIWLARGSTARWEREKRAARAPRPDTGPMAPEGPAARLRRGLARAVQALPRVPGVRSGRLKPVVDVLRAPKRLLPEAAPVRRSLRRLVSAVSAVPAARLRRRSATVVPDPPPADGGEGGALQPPHEPQRRRRRAFRFPHRAPRTGAPAVSSAGPPGDEAAASARSQDAAGPV